MNYRRIQAIKEYNRKRILKVNPKINDDPGIYFFTRKDEDGFKFAYVGQAKNLMQRLISHLSGYQQHIDLSIKKHNLYSKNNPYGWKIGFINCSVEELDEKEQEYIKKYAKDHQLLNVTGGGQGEGKRNLGVGKSTKGYRDGLVQGKKNASKEVAVYFDKYLDAIVKDSCYTKKGDPSKNAENALEKFRDFLDFHKSEGNK